MSVKEKVGQINPLKKSPILGATLAALGIRGCLPLHHGSQGCTAFTKTFLTQHFREIVPMQNTALTDISTIMGEDKNLFEGIINVIDKQTPEAVFIITTGISETRGDDVGRSVKEFREKHPEYNNTEIFYVNSPDFDGDAYNIYGKALSFLFDQIQFKECEKEKGRINIIPSMTMTAGDIDEIRDLAEMMGLRPVFIPDLSCSLSGNADHFYGIPVHGCTLEDIKTAGAAEMTLVVGQGLRRAGTKLSEKAGSPLTVLDQYIGIEASDNLMSIFMKLSGKEVPEKIKKQRRIAVDTMLDGHFYYGGKSAALAIEPDALYSLAGFIGQELGIDIPVAVTTFDEEFLSDSCIRKVINGDLNDLYENGTGVDFVVSSTNAALTADELGAGIVRMGIPVKDRVGQFNKVYAGYRGARELAAEIANILLERDEHESWEVKTENYKSKY